MTAEADLALLQRWRGGDASAGQELFARHFESIYTFFQSKCSNEADELTQATFLACLRAKDQFRADSSFRTYLFTIARHELYRVLKTRSDRGEVDLNLSSVAELVSSPGSRLARNQEHRQLVEALQRLPVAQQTLLELHYWEDMGIADLATIFDCPPVTIRTRLHRARAALREVLETAAPPAALQTLDAMDAWVRTVTDPGRNR